MVKPVRSTAVERTVRLDGVNIPVVVDGAGCGVPLVLINGLGTRMQSWAAFRAGLGAGRRVLSFDVPSALGQGAPPVRMKGHSRRVGMLLDAFDIDRADVLGYSWGGALAQQFTLDNPDTVRGLVLTGTNYGVGSLPAAPGPLFRLVTGSATSGESLKEYLRLFGGAARVWGGEPFASGVGFAGYWEQVYAFAGWSSAHRLPSLRQPTLVLAGDQDPLIPVCTTRTLGRLIPNSRVELISGGGHSFLLYERAAQVGEVVEAFLAQLDVAEQGTAVRSRG